MNSIDPKKIHYTIGDAAKLIGEAPSLIRFWENEFKQLKPQKTAKGIRKYTQKDIELLKLIHHLVKEKGMTLEGVRSYLKHQPNPDSQAELLNKLKGIKDFLTQLKKAIPK